MSDNGAAASVHDEEEEPLPFEDDNDEEAGDDLDEDDTDFIPTDHPMFKRLNDDIKRQLSQQHDDLDVQIRDKAEFNRKLTDQRETVGVELYTFQQQLAKLGDVIKVVKLSEGQLIASELLLIKVHATNSRRTAVLKTINGFGAKVKDIGHTTITAELTGLPSLIDRFIEKMTKHGIIELSRSGLTALETGDTNINEIEE